MIERTLLSVFRHRELVWEMAMRELKSRNKGAFLGWLWLVLAPLVQASAYLIIVGLVFRKGGDVGRPPFGYGLYVLSGMIPWQIMTRTLAEAPGLIRVRINLVKQVVYPIETLPFTTFVVTAVGSFVSMAIYLLLAGLTGELRWTVVLLPLPFVLLVTFLVGASWLFMIAGVLLKDLREIVAIGLGLLVYLSPVLIHESMVSSTTFSWIQLNPLAHIVFCFRDVLLATWHPWSWLVSLGMAVGAIAAGGWVIDRTKILINEYI